MSQSSQNAAELGRGTAGDHDEAIRHIELAAGERSASEQPNASRASDLRFVIGALFLLYGVMLLVASAFTTAADLHKAQGVNINLWTGLGMAVFGALMLAWSWWRPITEEQMAEATEDQDEAYPAGEPGAAERSETPL